MFFCLQENPTQLAKQRCDNVVTTSWLTLSQRCGMVKNESCGNDGLRRCDIVAVQRCHKVAITTLSMWFLGHFITDNSDFFPPLKRVKVTKLHEYQIQFLTSETHAS